ncbi:MAG: hypothetical protein EXR21_08790 [Flavobacteriaceae bacterium]|nr:hypothetical protein [Flavobacteriaceae bacterium]
MDYFALFGISESLTVDAVSLKKKYYDLSRSFHPDLHTGQPEELQKQMMQMTTEANAAYKILGDKWKRTEYLLHKQGLLNDNASLPSAFLADMMDLNEQLADLQFEPNETKAAQLKQEVGKLIANSDNELHSVSQQFDHADDAESQSLLPTLKNLHLKSKYLLRLKASVDTFAT